MQEPAWGLLASRSKVAATMPSNSIAPTGMDIHAQTKRCGRRLYLDPSTPMIMNRHSEFGAVGNLDVQSQAFSVMNMEKIPNLNWSSSSVSPASIPKSKMGKMHSASEYCLSHSAAAWEGIKSFRVSSIRRVSANCAEVTFAPVDKSRKTIDFLPGQYLAISHVGKDSTGYQKYFLTSAPRREYLQCSIFQGIDSLGFDALDSLKLSSAVGLTAPHGVGYTVGRPMVLISSGKGIAPMKSFLEAAPENVHFIVHVDASESSHPFRRDFRRSCIPNYFHYTSKSGRFSSEKLLRSLPHRLLECDFMLSGPVSFLESMQNALATMGVKRLHTMSC